MFGVNFQEIDDRHDDIHLRSKKLCKKRNITKYQKIKGDGPIVKIMKRFETKVDEMCMVNEFLKEQKASNELKLEKT